MVPRSARAQAAADLTRLSLALAEALEAGDLEAAERVVAERAEILDAVTAGSGPAGHTDVTAQVEAQATVLAADRRSQVALQRSLEASHAELGALAHGAYAMRAYLPAEPLAPGYVDRHD